MKSKSRAHLANHGKVAPDTSLALAEVVARETEHRRNTAPPVSASSTSATDPAPTGGWGSVHKRVDDPESYEAFTDLLLRLKRPFAPGACIDCRAHAGVLLERDLERLARDAAAAKPRLVRRRLYRAACRLWALHEFSGAIGVAEVLLQLEPDVFVSQLVDDWRAEEAELVAVVGAAAMSIACAEDASIGEVPCACGGRGAGGDAW